ncbi:hypothetical protein B0H16DRAFT_1707976 [Mycena metata]|uniref:Uncharacterized protein n=1 Tax=Mycena metata TaxID=1033252 RepID=A0AAD7P2B9_9AGAR|nr:hypothetical protein B0H16DRAFT_1707976 [Mycena metata]
MAAIKLTLKQGAFSSANLAFASPSPAAPPAQPTPTIPVATATASSTSSFVSTVAGLFFFLVNALKTRIIDAMAPFSTSSLWIFTNLETQNGGPSLAEARSTLPTPTHNPPQLPASLFAGRMDIK